MLGSRLSLFVLNASYKHRLPLILIIHSLPTCGTHCYLAMDGPPPYIRTSHTLFLVLALTGTNFRTICGSFFHSTPCCLAVCAVLYSDVAS